MSELQWKLVSLPSLCNCSCIALHFFSNRCGTQVQSQGRICCCFSRYASAFWMNPWIKHWSGFCLEWFDKAATATAMTKPIATRTNHKGNSTCNNVCAQLFHTQLFYTKLCHIHLFHTHTIFYAQLCHIQLFHTFMYTNLHTQHCHTRLFHPTCLTPSLFFPAIPISFSHLLGDH